MNMGMHYLTSMTLREDGNKEGGNKEDGNNILNNYIEDM